MILDHVYNFPDMKKLERRVKLVDFKSSKMYTCTLK
jgi:hypothetical protein